MVDREGGFEPLLGADQVSGLFIHVGQMSLEHRHSAAVPDFAQDRHRFLVAHPRLGDASQLVEAGTDVAEGGAFLPPVLQLAREVERPFGELQSFSRAPLLCADQGHVGGELPLEAWIVQHS